MYIRMKLRCYNQLVFKIMLQVCFTSKILFSTFFILLCLNGVHGSSSSHWAIHVKEGSELKARELALKHGFQYIGKVGELDNVYHFVSTMTSSRRKNTDANTTAKKIATLRQEGQIDIIERQYNRLYQKRTTVLQEPTDPLWNNQWTMHSTDSLNNDYNLRIMQAWIQGYTGKGVTVAIVDDGIEHSHPDLIQNYDDNSSFDFISNDYDPSPMSSWFDPNDHGTKCAGIIGMTKSNGKCGVGVAYNAKIAGLLLISSGASDLLETKAFTYHLNDIHIYSNSWGPLDNGYTVEGPRVFAAQAIQMGALKGRDGKGNIYVWASGNGGSDDCCSADGYVNSIYTIAVGSVDNNGRSSYFDEKCSAKLAVVFSYNSTYPRTLHNPTTTLRGQCTQTFTGTSAAAPLASGIIALTLQANPLLTWRDVQYLIVYSSNSVLLMKSNNNEQWITNGASLNVSSQFGFGVMDAEAMVTRAKHWINVPAQIEHTIVPSTQDTGFATNTTSHTIHWNITNTNITYIEHIVILMTLQLIPSHDEKLIGYNSIYNDPNILLHNGTRRGDIQVLLISPMGTHSELLSYRSKDFVSKKGYINWPFMSVQFWGENPTGNWKCIVSYKGQKGSVYVSDVQFKLNGVSKIPQSIRNIPKNCSNNCQNNRCSSSSSKQYCDSCKEYRDFKTLQCISSCPNYTETIISNYCIYNDSTAITVTPSTVLQSTNTVQSEISNSYILSSIQDSSLYTSSSTSMIRITNDVLNIVETTVLDKPKEPFNGSNIVGSSTVIIMCSVTLLLYLFH